MKKIVDINTGWHEKIIINQDELVMYAEENNLK